MSASTNTSSNPVATSPSSSIGTTTTSQQQQLPPTGSDGSAAITDINNSNKVSAPTTNAASLVAAPSPTTTTVATPLQPLSSLARLIFACEGVEYIPPVLPEGVGADGSLLPVGGSGLVPGGGVGGGGGGAPSLPGGKVPTNQTPSVSEVGGRPAIPTSISGGTSGSTMMVGSGIKSSDHHIYHTSSSSAQRSHHHGVGGVDSLSGSKLGGAATCEDASCMAAPARSTTLSTLLSNHPVVFPFIVKPNPNKYALRACFDVAKSFPSQLDAVLFSSSSVAASGVSNALSMSHSDNSVTNTIVGSEPSGLPTKSVYMGAPVLNNGTGCFKPESYTLRHHFEALVSASHCALSHRRDEMLSRLRHMSVFYEYIQAAEAVLNQRHLAPLSALLNELTPTNICAKTTQRSVTAARIEVFYLLAHMPLPTLHAAASVFKFGIHNPASSPPAPVSTTTSSHAASPLSGDNNTNSNITAGRAARGGGGRGAHLDPLVSALVNFAIASCGGGDCCVLPTRIADELITFQSSCFYTALRSLHQFNTGCADEEDGPSHVTPFLVAWSCAGWCVAKYLIGTDDKKKNNTINQIYASHDTDDADERVGCPLRSSSTHNDRLSSLVRSSISATRQLTACYTDEIQTMCAQVKDLASFLQVGGGTSSTVALVSTETSLSLQRLSLDMEWEMLKGQHTDTTTTTTTTQEDAKAGGGGRSHVHSELLRTTQEYLELFHRCTVQLPVTHALTASVAMNAADALAYLASHHKDISISILECPCDVSDDEDGHTHVSASAVSASDRFDGGASYDEDDHNAGTYRGLLFAAQRFGGCLGASSRLDKILPDMSPSDGASHHDLSRLLSDAASALLHQYMRVIQVSVPNRHWEAIQALPPSTYELIRIIEGAIETMDASRTKKVDASGKGGAGSGCYGGDDSPNFDLSLSNPRSNGGAATRSVC